MSVSLVVALYIFKENQKNRAFLKSSFVCLAQSAIKVYVPSNLCYHSKRTL